MARCKFFLTTSYEMPALGFHVSDGSTLDARVKARARETHDGKVSAYVRSAVERDLAGDTGSVISADVITSLATKLLGEREAALQFAAQQRAEQANTSAAQSDMAETAQYAAEAYFRNDYRPGGNSSVLVMEVSATISIVEQVPGWSGRWRARGRASIGYYVSSGGS